MANPYYDPGGQRAIKVNALFDRIARRYDRVNDWQSFGLHRLWKRALLAQARVQPGDAFLDLCCGTGDIALGLARRGAKVTGLDFSEPMLEAARRRCASAGVAGVRWVRGDAQHTPFPDGAFDGATISYGLRNLADWPAGLAEMIRVLRPGGRLLILDFGKPSNRLWRRLYFAYLRRLVPQLGRWFCGDADAYAYILESLDHYPAQAGVTLELENRGCRNLRLRNFLGGAMSLHYAERA